jgi:hypothetical protein
VVAILNCGNQSTSGNVGSAGEILGTIVDSDAVSPFQMIPMQLLLEQILRPPMSRMSHVSLAWSKI